MPHFNAKSTLALKFIVEKIELLLRIADEATGKNEHSLPHQARIKRRMNEADAYGFPHLIPQWATPLSGPDIASFRLQGILNTISPVTLFGNDILADFIWSVRKVDIPKAGRAEIGHEWSV